MTTLRGRSAAALVFAALGGAAIAFLIFPADMLLGAQGYWNNIVGDNATSLSGFYALAHDKWSWPILYTQLINPPDGANVYFVDAVPILVVFFKLVYKVTGILFPYFGAWILLSYALMAVAAFLTLRELNVSVFASFLASLLFVLLPEFMWRYAHIALIAQFVILFALLFYVRFVRTSSASEMIAVCAVAGLGVFLNPYLMVMEQAIIVAGVFDAWHRSRTSLRIVAMCCAALVIVTLVSALVAGLIGTQPLPKVGGFGFYSMNLLSPIVPQLSSLSFGRKYLVGVAGQYEGFNYLGAGVLFLVFIALRVGWRDLADAIKRKPFLTAVLIGLSLYAVSNTIYAGPYKILSIPYDRLPILDRITSTFRSSGRFFWPVGFCIVLAAVTIISQKFRKAATVSVLAASVVLQAIDVYPLVQELRANARRENKDIDARTFARLVDASDKVIFQPGWLCAAVQDKEAILSVQLIAARRGRPFDGAYLNRGDGQCLEKLESFEKNPFGSAPNDPMLVMMKNSISPARVLTVVGGGATCRDMSVAFVCGKGAVANQLADLGSTVTMPQLPLGEPLFPNVNAQPYMERGWTVASGGDFRWGEGSQLSIVGATARPVCGAIDLVAEIIPFSFKGHFVDRVRINLNGGPEIFLQLAVPGRQTVRATIPNDKCTSLINLQIKFDNLKSPLELGMNSDPRLVTWGFYNFVLK